MGSLTIYMYHDVRDLEDAPFPKRYLQKSFLRTRDFLAQLDFIKKKHTVISINELLTYTKGLDRDYAILTFDDGLGDHFRVCDYLVGRGLVGTFFVPVRPVEFRQMMDTHKIQFILAEGDHRQIIADIFSSIEDAHSIFQKYSKSQWADNYWTDEQVFVTRFLREYPDEELRQQLCSFLFQKYVTNDLGLFSDFYLTVTQIERMIAIGMTIGGHGYSSENLLNFVPSVQAVELQFTKDFLLHLGVKELFLSYPNGGVDDNVIDSMRKLGYTIGLTTRNQTINNWPPENLLCLPRMDAPQRIKL